MLAWCEGRNVGYIAGTATNARLERKIAAALEIEAIWRLALAGIRLARAQVTKIRLR